MPRTIEQYKREIGKNLRFRSSQKHGEVKTVYHNPVFDTEPTLEEIVLGHAAWATGKLIDSQEPGRGFKAGEMRHARR